MFAEEKRPREEPSFSKPRDLPILALKKKPPKKKAPSERGGA